MNTGDKPMTGTKDSGMKDIEKYIVDYGNAMFECGECSAESPEEFEPFLKKSRESKQALLSYLQSRIAEAEERQRGLCMEAYLHQNNIGQMVPSVIAKAILNAGGQDGE